MEKISKLLKKEINKNMDKQLAIWCIGTKKVVGDSLGPFVGEILIKNNRNKNIVIKGNFKNEVNYLNIKKEFQNLNRVYPNIYSIVVDSSLYTKDHIGDVFVFKNTTTLGSALNKCKYKIGDIGIKGVVEQDYKNPLKNIKVLEKVPINFIEKMSYKIANQILEVIC